MGDVNYVNQMTQTKPVRRLPSKSLATFIIKASWDATSVKLKIEARTEAQAVDKAWMKVSKMEGGMSCLSVECIGVR
jgi:hypothetical protein